MTPTQLLEKATTQKIGKISIQKTFKPTKTEKVALEKARKDRKAGKYISFL